ncbi:hypothetical protein PPS11_30066 [Pseudomonas putida S11]|nr:hypothetical protein PPS11_30066 [Pseudomonas putida S11]
MNRHIPGVALLVGALAISAPAVAHGGHGHGGWYGPGPLLGAAVVGAVVGATVYGGRDRTVYVERQPVYYGPPPVYRATTATAGVLPAVLRASTTRPRATAPTTARHRCITARHAGKC